VSTQRRFLGARKTGLEAFSEAQNRTDSGQVVTVFWENHAVEKITLEHGTFICAHRS
jgi:hypothetical protein